MITKIPKTKDVLENFTFEKNDKLQRETIANNFNRCFEGTEGNLILAINGEWGQGKSAFLHMWKNQLRFKEKEVIYLNLWEEDFYKEPFLSILNTFSNNFFDIKKDLISISKKILKHILEKKTGLNIDEFFDKSVYDEINNDKIKLKEILRKKIGERTDNFPLVVMIDELDRCNPLYAIEFLEVIKHFFDIDKIVFVLALDIQELEHSIKKVYGENLNTQRYLRKIIDVIYDLPNPSLELYFDHILQKYGDKYTDLSENGNVFRCCILKNAKNLRDIEKFFIRYNLSFKEKKNQRLQSLSFNENQKYFIRTYLLLLTQLNKELYSEIREKSLTKEKIKLFFEFLGIEKKNVPGDFIRAIFELLTWGKTPSLSNQTIKGEIETLGYNTSYIGETIGGISYDPKTDFLLIDFLQEID